MPILMHNYARPAMPLRKAAGMSTMRSASQWRAAAPTTRLVDVPPSSRELPGPIDVALASGSKASVPCPGPRHIILPKQLAEAVSLEEIEPGPDAPLLPPPAANLDTSQAHRDHCYPVNAR
jgi:hypothetical protein